MPDQGLLWQVPWTRAASPLHAYGTSLRSIWLGRCAAPGLSSGRSAPSASRFEPACTQARSKRSTTRWVASLCRSEPGWRGLRGRGRARVEGRARPLEVPRHPECVHEVDRLIAPQLIGDVHAVNRLGVLDRRGFHVSAPPGTGAIGRGHVVHGCGVLRRSTSTGSRAGPRPNPSRKAPRWQPGWAGSLSGGSRGRTTASRPAPSAGGRRTRCPRDRPAPSTVRRLARCRPAWRPGPAGARPLRPAHGRSG
jgi:hypothetical protein